MARNILVVEDDELLGALTAESLSSLYADQVLRCANADEALALMSAGVNVSLVFTDIHMPGEMDGLGLAREIWRTWPEVPMLLTSGDAVVPLETLPANASFLSKPWTLDELVECIDRLTHLPRRPA
ncbi:response regulator [Pseudomonas sp. NPDC090233]|uniref:response regulator n=1 Tax=Pseudomonas sp. NPDC090233 TaxID=3364479 RepID=UPI00383A20A2